jgi:hypothetical protein
VFRRYHRRSSARRAPHFDFRAASETGQPGRVATTFIEKTAANQTWARYVIKVAGDPFVERMSDHALPIFKFHNLEEQLRRDLKGLLVTWRHWIRVATRPRREPRMRRTPLDEGAYISA